MENVRIGNSVHVSWRLYNNNGSQYMLSGKIRRLWIISAALEKEITSYGILGRNEILFSIPADDLIRYGTYKIRLTIRESESETEDATYDLTQIFQVVSQSYPNASGAIGGVADLSFTSVLNNVVVERIEGLSAYEIAVNNGYEGTEQEWIAMYNNAVAAANNAAEEAVAATETMMANEESRQLAEAGRDEAERLRVSAEDSRVSAESSRVSAESRRMAAEQSRVSAESARVSAENARADQAASDHTRAETDHNTATTDHSTAESDHTAAQKSLINDVEVTVSDTTGTPSGEVEFANNKLSFSFSGIKGDKGDTGAQGPKGETGATGPQGPQGPQGPAAEVNEEDLDFNAADKMQFADRVYNSSTPDGLGYVILRKNKTFAQQVTATNTVYEIRYDFDLNAASVTIPAGCVLKFNGGKISNGTLVCTLTTISADPVQIFSGITLGGKLKNESIAAEWYGCVADGVTDNHDTLQAACDNAIQVGAAVRLLPGVYVIDESKGAIYIRFSADGQKFELRGAGSQFTTLKNADGSLDRMIAAGGNPRYLHMFYHIPAYGGGYHVSYAADAILMSGFTFDHNKRGQSVTPPSTYSWEGCNLFSTVQSYNAYYGTVKRYEFDDITLVDRIGSGIGTGNAIADLIRFHKIVDLMESNDWGFREGIYPLSRCGNVVIDECNIRYIQVEPTASQSATHHSHVTITNSRLGSFEWNRSGDTAEDSLSVSGCVFDSAYINLSGKGNMVFTNCVFNFRNNNSTIWNSPHFNDCTFNFFWKEDGSLPSINHRVSSKLYPVYTRCHFYTDDLPESPQANQSIFNNSNTTAPVENMLVSMRDCVFDVKTNYSLNGFYSTGNWSFSRCKITFPAGSSVFYVGSFASGGSHIDVIDCEFPNDNVIYETFANTADTLRGRISGRYTRTNILAKNTGGQNIGLDGSGLLLEVATGTALNVRLPKGTRVIMNGIIYTVIQDEPAGATVTVTPTYYKCEFVNKNMTTAEREALTGLPAIPIEAYDTTLNQPYYWTGTEWTAVAPDTSACELLANKVTSLSASSTDTEYPSAKCVYDAIFAAMDDSY